MRNKCKGKGQNGKKSNIFYLKVETYSKVLYLWWFTWKNLLIIPKTWKHFTEIILHINFFTYTTFYVWKYFTSKQREHKIKSLKGIYFPSLRTNFNL